MRGIIVFVLIMVSLFPFLVLAETVVYIEDDPFTDDSTYIFEVSGRDIDSGQKTGDVVRVSTTDECKTVNGPMLIPREIFQNVSSIELGAARFRFDDAEHFTKEASDNVDYQAGRLSASHFIGGDSLLFSPSIALDSRVVSFDIQGFEESLVALYEFCQSNTSSNIVEIIQSILLDEGYYTGAVTGVFDQATSEAIEAAEGGRQDRAQYGIADESFLFRFGSDQSIDLYLKRLGQDID